GSDSGGGREDAPVGAPPIVLVGLMGAGKSTVGPLLARRLGRRFIDLDREIERAEGRSIRALFEEHAEAGFRAAEARATGRLDPGSGGGLVIAAGGGWMNNPAA